MHCKSADNEPSTRASPTTPKATASSTRAFSRGSRCTSTATPAKISGQARKMVPWIDIDQKCCKGIGALP